MAGCSFFSVLLITAYVCMMRSPSILSVLPEGGDSRKQVMMVFVLAVIGCAVFTAYAAGLFFRQKSRETGVFLALGAIRRQLQAEMGKELAVISLGSCAAGAVLSGPWPGSCGSCSGCSWWTPRRWHCPSIPSPTFCPWPLPPMWW